MFYNKLRKYLYLIYIIMYIYIHVLETLYIYNLILGGKWSMNVNDFLFSRYIYNIYTHNFLILYLVLFSYVTSQFWCKYAWDSICIDPVSAEIAGEPGNFQENSPDAFHGRGGISMVVAVAVFSSLATDPMGPWEPLLVLIGAKRREWMGCWGLLGWFLIVIVDHSRKFPTKHQ